MITDAFGFGSQNTKPVKLLRRILLTPESEPTTVSVHAFMLGNDEVSETLSPVGFFFSCLPNRR